MNRFKKTVVGFVVVLVGFAATGCATGGYLGPKPYGGLLGDVMAGNLGMTCPGDYFVGPPLNRCLRDIGGNFGQYSNYPMYRGGMGGPQLSQADKVAVFCGLGASGVAMLLDATVKKIIGAGLLSAAACEVAAIASNRGNQKQGQGNARWGADGVPVALPDRPVRVINPNLWGGTVGRPNCLRNGLVTLQNFTGEILGVFEEGQDPNSEDPLAVLMPRESQCANADLRYEAWVRQTAISADRWVGGTQRIPRRPEARPGLVLVWR